ncbi:MAG: type II secretion system protein [Patescibacteria group bacterium]
MPPNRRGYTLLEIVITLGIITILLAITLVLSNPGKQFSKARNTERWSEVNIIVNAIGQNISDNRGQFACVTGAAPTSSIKMASATSTYNIAPCLVPTYLVIMPYDPTATSSHYVSNSDYDTGYFILRNATSGRITVSAPSAELGEAISATR